MILPTFSEGGLVRLAKSVARSELAKYIALGALSFGLGLALVTLLVEVFDVSEPVAGACGFVAALAVNFFLARNLIFASTTTGIGRQALSFILVSAAMRLAEFLLYLALTGWAQAPYYLAYTVTLLISNLGKFYAYKLLVFSKRSEKADNER